MKNLLVIEPDNVLRKIYTEVFSERGYNVTAVNSAQSAVMAADLLRPDAVILEIQLVEHSGIEFLYEFRSYIDWRDIPVCVNTQIPPQEFKGSWQLLTDELLIKDYLYKPDTRLKDLIKSIES
jgi:CheY-like chemotaxis protein